MLQRNVLKRFLMGAAGVVASVGVAGQALASSCATPTEVRAFQTRLLQTELMMAALACGETDRYNQFIRKFTPEISSGGNLMRSYFNRAYGGKEATTRLNSTITTYANESSRDRTAVGDYVFCGRASDTFAAVLQMPSSQLVHHVATTPYGSRHGLTECGGKAPSPVQAAVVKASAPAPAAKKAAPAAAPAKKSTSKVEPTKVAAKATTGTQRQ